MNQQPVHTMTQHLLEREYDMHDETPHVRISFQMAHLTGARLDTLRATFYNMCALRLVDHLQPSLTKLNYAKVRDLVQRCLENPIAVEEKAKPLPEEHCAMSSRLHAVLAATCIELMRFVVTSGYVGDTPVKRKLINLRASHSQ